MRETCLQRGCQHLAEESFVDNILITPHPPPLCPAPRVLAGSVNKHCEVGGTLWDCRVFSMLVLSGSAVTGGTWAKQPEPPVC